MAEKDSRRGFITDVLLKLVSGCVALAGFAGLSALAPGCGDDSQAEKYGPLFDARPSFDRKYGIIDRPPAPKYGVGFDAKVESK